MDLEDRSPVSRRLIWLAALIALWAVAIFGKLVLLQVVRHDRYLRAARQQQERVIEIPAPRGTIFDRNGQPLAMSVPMFSISLNPQTVPDIDVAANILSNILELDRTALYGRLRLARIAGRGFIWVKRKVMPEQAERLRSLHLEWIDFQNESQRHYPSGSLAANLIGSVDHEENGNSGIEASLNETLAGHPGTAHMLTDVKGRGIDQRMDTEPHAGTPLTLSIDSRIQYVAEREIAAAVQKHSAKAGSVVVMNPQTGEVLAMASYPTFDPNKPPAPREPASARFNNAVSVPFEPGSVFKVITLSAALETTNLRPDTLINCGNGAITLFGRTIHEATHGYGTIPMSLVLAKSSNIGAIQVGLRVGQEQMYEYVRRFGFGQRTGITLPAESPGLLRKLKIWGTTSLASIAMGHEVSTTSLQLAQACSVVANGGVLVRPNVVLRKGGKAFLAEPPRRVLKPETAFTMRQMMEGVVVLPAGTGHKARLNGYSSGGKTGSAVIYDFATKRYTHTYNGSFIGFAPVTNPAIVISVTVNGTRGTAGYGGQAAAPVFKVVAEEALRVLDVPKDLPDLPPDGLKKQNETDNTEDLAIADLGGGPPLLEDPEERATITTGPVEPGPKVPDFQGKSMRSVLAEASAMGITVLVDGTGVARGQEPPAGAALRAGARIRVRFTK